MSSSSLGPLIDHAAILHEPARKHWEKRNDTFLQKTRQVVDAFEGMMMDAENNANKLSGDQIRKNVEDLFMHGIGNTKWGTVQIKIFKAFLKSTLPFIYGDAWPRERARVMRELKMKKEMLYTLVNMARRNGKTYTTAGTAAALMFCVPDIKIAIFSTCKRTAQLLLNTVIEMIDKILDKGTHANRQDFVEITRNSESIVFRGPDGTKRVIGCFPGSVRVSNLFEVFFRVRVRVRVSKSKGKFCIFSFFLSGEPDA